MMIILPCNVVSGIPSTTLGGVKSDDRGCREGGIHDWHLISPEYTPVFPSDPQVQVEGIVVESHVSHADLPSDHTSHDSNFHVLLDPPFYNLNSLSNEHLNPLYLQQTPTPLPSQSSPLIMEMEWEIGTTNNGETDRFPKEFWPSASDRVWMMGRYIFDCGHPPPHTELHPPTAVAFTHFEPLIIPSAGQLPVLAAKTSVYIHGQGGYFDTPVGGRTYEFDVVLPPKPSPSSRLVTQIIDTPFGGPAPIITGPLSGPGPSDNHIHVNYDLKSVPASATGKFGSHIAAGWTDPAQTNVYHRVRVSFESIVMTPSINARLDRQVTCCPFRTTLPHTWNNLWVGVNGQYIELLGPNKGPFTDPTKPGSNPSPNSRQLSNSFIDTIIADNGLASTLNIKTTGWLSSEMDTCFGDFHPHLPSAVPPVSEWIHFYSCSHANTDPESLGSVNKQYTIGTINKQNMVRPTHYECSGPNLEYGGRCEFILGYEITLQGQPISAPLPTPP